MRRVSYRAEDNVRQWTTSEPRIGARVMVDPTAMVLGDISLGDDVSIWANCSIRADMHRISIGSGSNIQDNSVLHITHAGRFNPSGCPLVIGEQVTVGTVRCCTVAPSAIGSLLAWAPLLWTAPKWPMRS